MREWLLGIVLTAFAGGLARQLAPRGREQAMVRLVSGLLLALALFLVKVARGQPAADLLALITGMSAAGFLFRCVKSRKKSDIFWASLCTLLALFYLCRFFMRAA